MNNEVILNRRIISFITKYPK